MPSAAGDGGVGLEVGRVRGGVVQETRRLDDVFEHTAHVAVDVGHVELSTLHAFDDLLDLCGLSRFHQVVTGLYLSDGEKSLTDADPVGHHDALEAPVIAQDLRQKVVVAHRELVIDLVVGGHDGPRVTLADGDLEATQIELAGSTLGDAFVDTGTIGLL